MTDEMNRLDVPLIKPCRHMEQWVNALADESLTGFARWYTQLHVRGCRRCYAALEAIRQLKARLKALHSSTGWVPATLGQDRRAALEAAMDAVDAADRRGT